jgi:hypothetical protein
VSKRPTDAFKGTVHGDDHQCSIEQPLIDLLLILPAGRHERFYFI